VAKAPIHSLPFMEEDPLPDFSGLPEEDFKQPTVRADRQEFFLPRSGFVWFYPEEVRVINHPAFQRLSRINQLGQAYLVFRGGTHKRMEHVLGAVGVVQRVIDAVEINSEKAVRRGERDARQKLSDEEVRFVRLGALLHDIGHLASGHTLEDELNLFGKHDEDARLDLVFNKTDWDTGSPCRSLAAVIDSLYSFYVPSGLAKKALTATTIVRLLTRKPPKDSEGEYDPKQDRRFAGFQRELETSAEIRLEACSNMIGNTICADLLDYIHRDWYHVGRPLDMEDRIFQYMEIRHPDLGESTVSTNVPDRCHKDKFVVSLGSNVGAIPKVRTDGVSAILGLLERRFELAETVLFHRTKLAAGSMLDRALFELWGEQPGDELPEKLLELTDEGLVEFALAQARDESKKLTASRTRRKRQLAAAEYLLTRLRSRRLYKSYHSVRQFGRAKSEKKRLTKIYAPERDRERLGARNRAFAARRIEADFELPPGSVTLCCCDVKPKIADVQIRVNGEIEIFSVFEKTEDSTETLSGGHLNAQIERFKQLWRLDVFIEKHELRKLERERPATFVLLRAAVEANVIKTTGRPEERQGESARLAKEYVDIENAKGRKELALKPREELILAAAKYDPKGMGLEDADPEWYPTGAPTMNSFWSKEGNGSE
jgi:HD superfamily phosphohydrolase